jgi:hypothetical protein
VTGAAFQQFFEVNFALDRVREFRNLANAGAQQFLSRFFADFFTFFCFREMSASKSDELLVSVGYVKYRQKGPGKSPLGTLSVFKDRVEWKEDGKAEPLLNIPYSNIKSKFTSFYKFNLFCV